MLQKGEKFYYESDTDFKEKLNFEPGYFSRVWLNL